MWLLINSFEILSIEFEAKYFWGRVQYIPLVILPLAWFCFSHSYAKTQYQLKKVESIATVLMGMFLAGLAITNETHNLFWSEVTLQQASNVSYLHQQIGIVFVVYVFYMLLLVFAGIYQIIRSIRVLGPMSSWQGTILLISISAVFASIVVDVSQLSFFPEPELASIVLAFVIPIVGYTLDKLRYADIMPAAYYQVFEHLEDGVIVTSPDNRIIDMNIRAMSLSMGSNDGRMDSLSRVFPFLSPVQKSKKLVEPFSVEINTSGTPIILDISVAPIVDRRSQTHSNIIVLRDVTERHMRERILLQRNEELEILNQISGFAASTRKLSEVLTFVVELSCITFRSSGAYIAKVDLNQDQLTIMAGFFNLYTKQTVVSDNSVQLNFKLSEIAPQLIDWLNAPTHHNITHLNSASDDITNTVLKKFLVQSALSFPLHIKGRLYGFISIIESEKHRDFESSEIQLLQSIAHQVGSAIENAQLYDELTREVSERTAVEEQLRNSLKEKDTLLKEVHHRVKNNLQVISSLLRLQLISINDPKMAEVIQDSQSRIQSMALVHELLYQSEDLNTIDLGEYLEFLSHSLTASYQSKSQQIDINTQCHSFDVTIETAITCGLLLNELVSNAIKHAFPMRSTGKIDISINPLGEEEIQLIVQDDGIGLPTTEETTNKRGKSLGLKLIDSFINQLDARVKITTEFGTCYEIIIPISNWGK